MIEIAWLIVAGTGAVGLMFVFALAMVKFCKFGLGDDNE